MTDNRKDLVDEQKRRARRRLVGAAILALAAAVVLPLFLESEPKPLGQDVQILIPAVEGSKFVSQLSPVEAATKPKPPGAASTSGSDRADTRGEEDGAKLATKKPLLGTLESGKVESGQTAANAAPKGEPKPAGLPESGPGAAGAAVVAQAAPAPSGSPKSVPPAAATAGAPAAAKPAGKIEVKPAASVAGVANGNSGFVVQLGAYADKAVAAALQTKLKAAGFSAYVERVETSKEKLHRVRVGPYPNKETAEGARVQLKGRGHSGIVVPLS